MNIMRIGLDLAKNVFEVYGVDAQEKEVQRKTLKRKEVLMFFCQLEPCIVGMESCGGAHYWARELKKLGHEVRMMAPQFVAPYRKGSKNDRNDAEAICEAAGRPNMRFVPVKTEEQQAVLTVHRARSLMVGERTALVNQIRGFLTEYGIVLPQGRSQVRSQLPRILEDAENAVPYLAREVFADQYARLCELDRIILGYDHKIDALAKAQEDTQRLMQLEGIGPLTATALVATVGDIRQFKNGRQFAAWLGLVPRQWSSGGKPRHGRITKRGDVYLRTLLIHGARTVMRYLDRKSGRKSDWVKAVKERRGFNKAAVALAAKHARILWAMLSKGVDYRYV
ncbi:MAG: IS110 family transposase [Oceanospirillaceae bacterium]|nr:IS110 family transposase [Oceanospirillaceae bacterium]|tara:strand:- start:271 stop:1284 length:1014 start_codon:yes stop_codon:yes gene_type:complete